MQTMRKVASTIGAIGVAGWMSAASAQAQPEQQRVEAPAAMSAFVRDVRRATHAFQDVNAATAAGYVSTRSCVSGPTQGAMGVHFVNEAYIADGLVDVRQPDVLVYEPDNGRLRLVAIEFLVHAEQWDGANPGPPVLGGQHFHYVGAPNRLRSPAYYELHVWAWKKNPNGIFSDWNTQVSCAGYSGATSDEAAASGAAHGH
jgi:hypothetical protein